MAAELDHVVMLLPYELLKAPPSWITDNFFLSPGGTHADQKTENRLVLFKDGTYLELIAFINDDPVKRKGHWWDKPYGVVDFAFTTKDEKFPTLPAIRRGLSETGTDISYSDPQEGGRLTPDGVELQWRVTFPTNIERGNVPFWCHDLTPRQRRVAITPENTTHPCGALGMAGVRLRKAGSVSGLAKAFSAILDSSLSDDGHYEIRVPHASSTEKPSIRIQAEPDGNHGKSDPSLALVIRTSLQVPDIHQHIHDGVASILFEQAT
ncbi:uncharacterized protein RCC_02514 [Ramularia collo-cygni]|uniref:Glyoxalase-like domain-containing protein n=1 Tax=Ramularia collo-cygni TaxID=112498 RepID=A0A2D3V5B4_9PEZI|nr:uncharacterized protein RCC_02514 [Ramularia collo-cygni]CZT16679.1 uncharacterized protein RCC_02514 [Ramularia collo-cygni]